MLAFLPAPLIGIIALVLYIINTVLCVIPLYIVAFFKFIIPFDGWRKGCGRIINRMANIWIDVNNWNLSFTKNIRWDVQGIDLSSLNPEDWHIVLANHQSWVDILVLQKIFHRKIPLLKFFIKKELIWVPFLGPAWWALDFPFMKRYSKEFLEKNPHLRGKDIETTRKACEKFKTIPISIMNFVEGTRFTSAKHCKQQSPYRRLLRPKAGGVAMVLAAMEGRIRWIVNTTIAYPGGKKGLWDFLAGKVTEVRVRVERLPITEELLGDYYDNPKHRENIQNWLGTLWREKDAQLEELLQPASRDA
mgnify:CR=1 FL=1